MSRLCRHFGTCGGCQFQDLPEPDYRKLKREMVTRALARHGLPDIPVDVLAALPPATRRRATLSATKRGESVALGFRAARSHHVVDMQECFVLAPAVANVVAALREPMGDLLREGEEARLVLTECVSGIDIECDLHRGISAEAVSRLARRAEKLRIARISINGETAVQFAPSTVELSGVAIALPHGAFLQPTVEGEMLLQDFVRNTLNGAEYIADLFAGCGTFTLALAASARVHAVDSNESSLTALSSAARNHRMLKPVTVEARDLGKQPLRPRELNAFDAVVLDPPRAGALAQARALAASDVARIAYVSCNPDTFGRDARILIDAGYRLEPVRPVDQFLWSSHIELAALFSRR